MQAPSRVFTRSQLLDGVWGNDVYVDERTVDVHIGRLRKALVRGWCADPIRTVRGAGYSFETRCPSRRSSSPRRCPQAREARFILSLSGRVHTRCRQRRAESWRNRWSCALS